MTSGGLRSSGTRGSTPADGSPRLVAAFRALHRPSTPRHPPCARRSSAAMLAHDAEPTGSTHVHHSPLVNVPETLTSLVRTIHPPRRTADASHEPHPGPTPPHPPAPRARGPPEPRPNHPPAPQAGRCLARTPTRPTPRPSKNDPRIGP